MKTFNIFQVAGIWKSEEIHTRIIAELLNPKSKFHDMGTALLEPFVTNVLPLPLSDPQEELCGATVETEVQFQVKAEEKSKIRRIDMVIETKHYYLPFEVKIWASDQKSQLYDYYQHACSEAQKINKKVPHIYYLTPDGHAPSAQSCQGKDGSLSTKATETDGEVVRLSWDDIQKWLETCLEMEIPNDVRSIIVQLRDNIQGYSSENMFYSGRHPGFSSWQADILDEIYQELSQHYNLTWTECTDRYMTCTLNKKGRLEFALRIQKENKDSVSLHLICGLTPKGGTPNYALAGPYICDHATQYRRLLSDTFSSMKNVSQSTAKSRWDRMEVIHCKKEDGTCLEKIKEVFSWLNDNIKENLKRKS